MPLLWCLSPAWECCCHFPRFPMVDSICYSFVVVVCFVLWFASFVEFILCVGFFFVCFLVLFWFFLLVLFFNISGGELQLVLRMHKGFAFWVCDREFSDSGVNQLSSEGTCWYLSSVFKWIYIFYTTQLQQNAAKSTTSWHWWPSTGHSWASPATDPGLLPTSSHSSLTQHGFIPHIQTWKLFISAFFWAQKASGIVSPSSEIQSSSASSLDL